MEKQKNWFHKHPILTTIIVIFALLVFFALINSIIKSDSETQTNNENSIENSENQQINDPEWHEVTAFAGTSDKKTDTFSTNGDRFRLTYTANPANEYSIFYLYVYRPGENLYTESFTLESGTESSISYEGEGEYYLDIKAANLRDWTVKIEDYY